MEVTIIIKLNKKEIEDRINSFLPWFEENDYIPQTQKEWLEYFSETVLECDSDTFIKDYVQDANIICKESEEE